MIAHLISGPRNLSTALMYSFAQREDMEVIDEPLYGYYLAKTGLKHPGREASMMARTPDLDLAMEQYFQESHHKPNRFLKNMAHHIDGVDPERWNHCKTFFLIRNPEELIASFSKVIPEPTLADIGLADEWTLFNAMEKDALVMDADDLLSQPEDMLKTLCENLGLPWDKKMLSWPPGPREEDGPWAMYWYGSVHSSTQFEKPKKEPIKLSEESRSLLKKAAPIYKKLYDHRIKL